MGGWWETVFVVVVVVVVVSFVVVVVGFVDVSGVGGVGGDCVVVVGELVVVDGGVEGVGGVTVGVVGMEAVDGLVVAEVLALLPWLSSQCCRANCWRSLFVRGLGLFFLLLCLRRL